jgi:colanic acid/amylovoran biosynthesis glycosyltransferase
MAHGVPVVATAVGGVPQLLDSGAGTLVPPRDPTAMAEAIRTYLEDEELRQRAGEIGRREVEANYSINAMRDRTLDVIREIPPRRSQTIGVSDAGARSR